jgi:hypothetical protein
LENRLLLFSPPNPQTTLMDDSDTVTCDEH